MIRIEYQRQVDEEISPEELEIQDGAMYRSENNGPTLQTWPQIIGISQIISGFITAILGILEVFVIPLIVDPAREDALHLGKDNCFGAGLWAGFLMILTGSAATRASISKRASSVYRFFNLTILTLLIYAFLSVLLIVGYGINWTTHDVYQNSAREGIHLFVTLSTELGLLFALTAFLKYYRVVLLGEFGLLSKWITCFIDCCVPVCILNLQSNRPPDRCIPDDAMVI
ncbi:hypothetical protein CHS0354_008498 [Potamilus streckersoni]|uniref:Uncharacterized protein n=1 Tax=Potamilus streckersoni TaxID=2493646 RepID=A0AAE0VR50_9BIVA|nr:hypothetical protein CHS0354_008498 [Potamilus streckersoni]